MLNKMRWTGFEKFYDSDEGTGKSIAAGPGDVLELSDACAKRLAAADPKWEKFGDTKPAKAEKA